MFDVDIVVCIFYSYCNVLLFMDCDSFCSVDCSFVKIELDDCLVC